MPRSSNLTIRVGLPYATEGVLLDAALATGGSTLISAGSLHRQRRRPLPDGSRPWSFRKIGRAAWISHAALDSAGFVAMRQGGYRWTVAEYVRFVVTNAGDGALPFPWEWWSAMDYCCEPEIAGDRAEVLRRVAATVDSYSEHLAELISWRNEGVTDVPDPMPVLQGRLPADYLTCADGIRASIASSCPCTCPDGDEWCPAEWHRRTRGLPSLVGVGSVCRRDLSGPDGLLAVLDALHAALPPHVRLHLFGVKGAVLSYLDARYPGRVASIDSMAWDYRARCEARAAGISNTVAHRATWLLRWHATQKSRLNPTDDQTDDRGATTERDHDRNDDDNDRDGHLDEGHAPDAGTGPRAAGPVGTPPPGLHDHADGAGPIQGRSAVVRARRSGADVGPVLRAGADAAGERGRADAVPCQRWNHRRASFRPGGEPFDPSRYGCELIDSDKVAKAFVKSHHYSGSYPAARCRVGLYRTQGLHQRQLVGVAVFSVPMSAAALRKHCGTTDAVELGRFVLLDDVEANGETWFLARAMAALADAKPDVSAVLSYSDPIRRVALDGSIVLPGHVGTIYQAHNARHTGRSKAATHWLDRTGRILSPRSLSKIRNDHRGRDYAEAQLIAAGAPARQPHEDGRAWVKRALVEGPFRRLRHPGNLAYVWPVGDKRARKATARGFPDACPYPKAAHLIAA